MAKNTAPAHSRPGSRAGVAETTTQIMMTAIAIERALKAKANPLSSSACNRSRQAGMAGKASLMSRCAGGLSGVDLTQAPVLIRQFGRTTNARVRRMLRAQEEL